MSRGCSVCSLTAVDALRLSSHHQGSSSNSAATPVLRCCLHCALVRHFHLLCSPVSICSEFHLCVSAQAVSAPDVTSKLGSGAEVIQLYRYPGLSSTASVTLLHKVSSCQGETAVGCMQLLLLLLVLPVHCTYAAAAHSLADSVTATSACCAVAPIELLKVHRWPTADRLQ
jgi:hypothetical protein